MHRNLRYVLGLAALLALAVVLLAAPVQAEPGDQSAAPEPQATPLSLYPSPNERIGVGLVYAIADITSYNVTPLQAGWYADWSDRPAPPHPNGMDYVPLVSTDARNYPPNWTALAARIQRNPGDLYLIGNEPEGFWQENLTPAQYAVKYHDVYTFIKSVDPTAQVANGGMILPSPLRLQWLDMVLQEYQTRYGVRMPIDVWNTHMQMVNEVSCSYDPDGCWGAEIPAGITANFGIRMSTQDNARYDLFVELITGMRTWMNARGYRNTPLLISEYGVLMPSDYLCDGCTVAQGDLIVASFMTRTFEFMLNTTNPDLGLPADGNRLVQRWMWYTLNDQPYDFDTNIGFNGGLFDYRNKTYPGTMTFFGKVFSDFVAPLKVSYIDLKPAGVTAQDGGTGSFTLTVKAANVGNTAVNNIKVRICDSDPQAGTPNWCSDKVIAALGIRNTAPGTLAFQFTLPPGQSTRTFFVTVDPDNAIVESNKANNTASYLMHLGTYNYHIMLPLITKDFSFSAH
jgi:hypothetical protein